MKKIVNVTYSCSYGSFNLDIEIDVIENENLIDFENRVDNLAYDTILSDFQNHSKLESYL